VIAADDLTVEVRDPDLKRRGQVDHRVITDLTLGPVWNGVGTWSLTLPRSDIADKLRRPGWGLYVTYGDRTFSGPTTAVARSRSADSPSGSWAISGLDDNVGLRDAYAYPSPQTDDPNAQAGTDGSGYDLRAGATETVMKGLVRANIGDLAPASRRLGQWTDAAGLLDIEPDLARGVPVRVSARFDQLGTILASLATVSGLSFNLRMVAGPGGAPGRWLFEVTQPRDLTKKVRLDIDADNVSDVAYSYGAPEVTRPIVLGQGDLAARQVVAATTPDSIDAEQLWRRRIESVIDQRQTSDAAELVQAALEALEDKGSTTTGMSFTLKPGGKRFGIDYWLGDLVTVVPDDPIMWPDGEFADVLTAGSITFTDKGLKTVGVVGNVQSTSRSLLLQALRLIRDQGARLGRLERS